MRQLLIVFIMLLMAGPVFAEEFNVKGYEINLSASRSGDVVEVSGRLREGPECGNLKLTIFLHNEHGNRASVITTLKDVGDGGSRLIEGTDQLIFAQGRDWEISSVFASCISDGGY